MSCTIDMLPQGVNVSVVFIIFLQLMILCCNLMSIEDITRALRWRGQVRYMKKGHLCQQQMALGLNVLGGLL